MDMLSADLGTIVRSQAYHLLDLEIVKTRLLDAPDQISTHPESDTVGELLEPLTG
jgi:hypothetical protein